MSVGKHAVTKLKFVLADTRMKPLRWQFASRVAARGAYYVRSAGGERFDPRILLGRFPSLETADHLPTLVEAYNSPQSGDQGSIRTDQHRHSVLSQ